MDRSSLVQSNAHIEPAIECVLFDEDGAVEGTFTTPLKAYMDPLRYGLADDFIGPPAAPTLRG